MVQITFPGLNLRAGYDDGEDGYGTALSEDIRKLSAIGHLFVIARTVALPGSPNNGDRYVLANATGGGAQHDIAYFDEDWAAGWVFISPYDGFEAWCDDENVQLRYTTARGWYAIDADETPYTPEETSGPQTVAEALDQLLAGGGGGSDDQTAAEVPYGSTSVADALDGLDTRVAALEVAVDDDNQTAAEVPYGSTSVADALDVLGATALDHEGRIAALEGAPGGDDDQTAGEVSYDGGSDRPDNVQEALDDYETRITALEGAPGGDTDDQTASEVPYGSTTVADALDDHDARITALEGAGDDDNQTAAEVVYTGDTGGPNNVQDALDDLIEGAAYDIPMFIEGNSSDLSKTRTLVVTRDFYLPASFASTRTYAGTTDAAGGIVFNVSKNGVNFGTLTWGAGSNTATLSAIAPTFFTAGDRIGVSIPASLGTLANISITFFGIRLFYGNPN